VYVDFGWHPGRDRLPREAALAGCVVFSTRHGAAGYEGDMPLSDWYKFDTLMELNWRIDEVLGGRDGLAEQAEYRNWVAGNRAQFEVEVAALLNVSNRVVS